MNERFKDKTEEFLTSQANRRIEQKKKSPVTGIVLKIAAAVAVMLGTENNAKAQQLFEFGDDVNNRTYYSESLQGLVLPEAKRPQLVVMPDKSRVDMYFSALQPDQEDTFNRGSGRYDIYVKRLRIQPIDPNDPEQGVKVVGLGEATSVPGFNDQTRHEKFLLPIPRLDGRFTTIADSGGDIGGGYAIVDNTGADRWGNGDFTDCSDDAWAIHPSRLPGKVRVTASFSGWPYDGKNPWVVDIAAPNWCTAIKNAIDDAAAQGLNPYDAGLLDLIESSGDEVWAPETLRLVHVTRDATGNYDFVNYLLLRDPPSGASFDYLKRNPDGTYTIQTYENNYVYPVQYYADSMVEVATSPPGRPMVLAAFYIAADEPYFSDGDLRAMIIKGSIVAETPEGPGVLKDVPVVVEEQPDAIVDDDEDGDPNELDATPWLASGDTDVAGPSGEGGDGVPDIYQAQCDVGGYVGQAPQGTLASNGLAVCELSELGYEAAYRENGQPTKYHVSGGEVVIENGAVAVQPGQKIRYMHTRLAGSEGEPSRPFTVPDGYAFKIKVNSTKKLDGTDGTATLTYTDILNQPVTVTFNGPTNGWQEFPAATGIIFGAEGSDFEIDVLSEYTPMPCPPACAADGGVDAAVPDGPLPDAPLPDAPFPDGPLPDGPLPDAPLPDAPFPDGAFPDALMFDAQSSDSSFPDGPLPDAPLADAPVSADASSFDANPADAITADATTINPDAGALPDSLSADAKEKIASNPGCNCELHSSPQSPQSPENPSNRLFVALAGIAAIVSRRVRRTAKSG